MLPGTLLRSFVAALTLVGCASPSRSAQSNILEASASSVDVHVGEEVTAWRLAREANPDIFNVGVPSGERREVCFVSDERSLCRVVRLGEVQDFFIRYDGYDYPTRVVGIPPAANFDAAYQAEHRGRVEVMVPEVYELVNIAIALTPTARVDRWLVAKHTQYYSDLEAWFSPVADHPFVAALDVELSRNRNQGYYRFRMNGFAFEFAASGEIVRSAVYDRTGFPEEHANALAPLLSQMNAFARESRFREFYSAHAPFYDEQVGFFQSQIRPEHMIAWLQQQFPNARDYDGYRVLFTPLALGNQSVTHFESNGYRELQPHVSFPYPRTRDTGFSSEARTRIRGAVIFTELNHGFINPAAEPHRAEITRSLADRTRWVAPNTSSDFYANPMSIFLEMMNWGLVSLYFYDFAPASERDALIERVGSDMVERGFIAFPEFNRFLVDSYASRAPGATVESLYPAIISWCEERAREQS